MYPTQTMATSPPPSIDKELTFACEINAAADLHHDIIQAGFWPESTKIDNISDISDRQVKLESDTPASPGQTARIMKGSTETTATSTSANIPEGITATPRAVHNCEQDERKSHSTKRIIGNMLLTRIGRAAVQSVYSTIKLQEYLSPWGDNNRVTLPNIRKRDIGLVGFAHLGIDGLAPAGIDIVGDTVNHATSWTMDAAQALATRSNTAKKTKSLKPSKPKSTKVRAGIISMEIRIKHKLIDENADITLFGESEQGDLRCCRRGWFCPYFYASGRTPRLARSKNFTVAGFWGPGLKADVAFAPTVLARMAAKSAQTSIAALCPWQPSDRPQFSRMAILFLGITPCRTMSLWSQARVPNESRIRYHVLNDSPIVVLPVNAAAPIVAWSCKTLSCLGQTDFDKTTYVTELTEHLAEIVDTDGLDAESADWRATVEKALGEMAEVANQFTLSEKLKAILDPERAGLVMFRY